MDIGDGVVSHARKHVSTLALIALLGAGAATYLAFPSRVFECDSVIYATKAIHGDISDVLQLSNLGYSLMERGAARIGQRLSPPASPICITAYVSLAAGLAGIFLFWRLIQSLGATASANLLLSGSLLFSYTYWHFSLQAESHILAGFFLILLSPQVYRHIREPTVRNAIVVSLILAAATLMHQTSVLVLPAIIVGMIASRRDGKDARRHVLAVVITYVTVLSVPCLLGAIRATKGSSAREIWQWMINPYPWASWGQWRIMSLPAAGIGLIRSFIGSHYLLGLGPIEQVARRLFPFASLQDEMIAAGLVKGYVRVLLIPVQTALLLFFGWAFLRTVRNLRSVPAETVPYVLFLVTWVLVFATFVVWWAPERAEFWLGVLIPALLLLGLPGTNRIVSGVSLRVSVLLLAALFTLNFLGSILPQSARGAEPETCVVVAIDAIVKPGDIVLSDCSFRGRASRYVRSFEKVNLLKSFISGEIADPDIASKEGPYAPEQANHAVSRIPVKLIPYAISSIDSLLEASRHDERSLYIIMSPLSEEVRLRVLYSAVLSAVDEKFLLSGLIPLRAPVALRKVISRRPWPER